MKSYLVIFFVTVFLVHASSFRYGVKRKWPRRPRCDEFNPPALKHVNFDNIPGKYYSIRAKTPCTQRNGPTLAGTVEWVPGKYAAIRNFRLKNFPTFCVIVLREFTPINGTAGSKFRMTLEEDDLTVEFRVLHYDPEYVMTWVCFKKNKYGKCIDWASGLLRSTPNNEISRKDMKRLDRIARKKLCKTISEDYEKREIQSECRDFTLPSKKKYY